MKKRTLKNMRVIFKNFRGLKTTYNNEGDRNFNLVIDDQALAEDLIKEGWAVKEIPDEDGTVAGYRLSVKVNYSGYQPPRIYKVSMIQGTSLLLDEDTVGILDLVPIEYVDIIINPYSWTVRGESGIKAYCHSMYAIIEETELDLKWARIDPMDNIEREEFPEEPPF